MNKVDRYEWSKLDRRGNRECIDLVKLNIDRSYQREEVSERTTLRRAGEFDLDLCGELLVSHREQDGKYYILDGQQRYLAAVRRGDITSLWCLVRKCADSKEEAILFYNANVLRNAVSAFCKWRSRLKAQASPEVDISRELSRMGLRVVNDGKLQNSISCPNLLISLWNLHRELFVPCLRAGRTICGSDNIPTPILKGAMWLLENGVCMDDHAERLRQKGGTQYIIPFIKGIAIMAGGTALSERTCGLGMLEAINKHLRVKVRVETEQQKGG